ncbi:hypothetical protein MUO14_03490 [Halobacillus shinanisalinarum]|uniref:Uncharacterized protein n=1 Tax=Halobacillus shinanisalinarum TaxID=2932258 RepID=A0ABY4H0S5_9BACI|nr:hypothetical protein [Halobacillus shinanisalinarum]UOQ94046.1 hypothetical protein MUO14_03490 [Halobacillus shinanisalinarum]
MKKQTNVVREGTSKMYLIGLGTMTAALLFFLCSGFVFGSQNQVNVQQTPLNEQLNLSGSGEMIIEEWTYNPNRQLMVVTLNIDKSTDLLGDPLTFIAQEKANSQRKVPTTIEYHDEGQYVISIQDVSPSFEVMALDVHKHKEKDEELLDDPQQEMKGGEEVKELARIYADQRKVKTDSTLTIQTEQEYEIAALSRDIKGAKQTMQDKEKQIQRIEQKLHDIDQELVELESKRLYETGEEKEQTNARIRQLENEKDQLNREATENETTIQTIQKKLTMLKEKRDMIDR